MNIENQVCTLKQGEKLKEFGIRQLSQFYWKCNEIQSVITESQMKQWIEKYLPTCNDYHSAYTVSEITRAIGRGTKASEKLLDAVNKRMNQGYSFVVAAYDVIFLADFMIEQIEKGTLLVEDCNDRLLHK